jgi:hypothetical protein
MIKNINEKFGDPVEFENLFEMKKAIEESGFKIPSDGLKEGRDYEVIQPQSSSVPSDNQLI